MDDLVAFMRAALDEDEASAKAAAASPPPWTATEDDVRDVNGHVVAEQRCWGVDVMPPENAAHIARWDPARVLAEVEAKRTRIAMLVDSTTYFAGPAINEEVRRPLVGVLQAVTRHLLRLEAQVYADRPGFKDAWRLT
jgi:hypothetical protein